MTNCHNHGPDEGPGLACPERTVNGRQVGACMDAAAPTNWKPGDVAMVECSDGEWRRAMCRTSILSRPAWQFADGAIRLVSESAARPLLVIDTADTGQMDELHRALFGPRDGRFVAGLTAADLARALERFAEPVEVFEHYPGPYLYQTTEKVVRGLCGKVWVPSEQVTVMGRCPECMEIVDGSWVA